MGVGGGGLLDKSILKLISAPVWALAGLGAELGKMKSPDHFTAGITLGSRA